jgi:hypothetical protein
MKMKLCDIDPAAAEKLPQFTGDKSGIGAHYVDAWIKPMNIKLEDGTPVKCKRRGLKIVLSAGARKGEGLMRRFDVSPDAPGRAPRGCHSLRNWARRGERIDIHQPLTAVNS